MMFMKMCFCVRYTDHRRPRDVAHRFGFGGYAGGVALDAADDALSDGLGDEDVARALRRCAHKSSTATKLKALRELYDALFGESGAAFDDGDGGDGADARGRVLVKSQDVVMAMLKPWTRAYEKLSADGDVGVRRDATIMHGHIARASGKSLARVLKGTTMMPSWMKAISDPSGEVARAASDAFAGTFSTEERRSGAIAIAHAEIFDDLGECLRKKSPADMVFREGSESEQFGRFERSILSSLGALANACSRLHDVESADADAASHTCSALVLELRCLRAQVKSEYPSIRREAYASLATLAKCAANEKATPAWREALARCVPSIAAVAFALISTEQDQGCIRNMWELILGVAIAHPSAWDAIDVEKSFMPGVRSHFERSCHGAASTSAPSLLPLIAHMPAQSLIARSDDESGTPMSGLVGILDAVFTGWTASSSSAVRANEAKATLPALREGVLYGILKLAPMTDHAEECAQFILHTRVVDRWMREFLARGDSDALDVMCDALKTLGAKPHCANAVVDAWAKLGDITEDALRDPERADLASGMYARMLASNTRAESTFGAAAFAKAVFAEALATPTLANSKRLASMVDHLGLDVFDGGGDAMMQYCMQKSPPVPGAGMIVAATVTRDAERWDDALKDALENDDARVVAETLTVLAKAAKSTNNSGGNDQHDVVAMRAWKRDALDALVERRASTAVSRSTDVDVLVAAGGAKNTLMSSAAAIATLSVLSRESSHLQDSSALRSAYRAWVWPPPSDASVVPAWSAAVGCFFNRVLRESLATTSYRESSYSDEDDADADSGGDDGGGIEFIETVKGDVNREWLGTTRDVKRFNASMSSDARTAALSALVTAGADAAMEHIDSRDGYDDSNIGLLFLFWAKKTVDALDAFNPSNDDDTLRAVAIDACARRTARECHRVQWLDALCRVRFGWRAMLDAMTAVDAERATDVAACALTSADIDAKAFASAVLRGACRTGNAIGFDALTALISRAFANADADAVSALNALTRHALTMDATWCDSDVARRARTLLLDIASAKGEAMPRATLATVLPRLMPSDVAADDVAREFVNRARQSCVDGVCDRRVPLDGPALALVAACFTRSEDVDGDGASAPTLNDAFAAGTLMDVFRALAKRDAADAAAEAAAARFGGGAQPQPPSLAVPTTPRAISGDAGVADVTAAITRRCPAALDARDWGAIIGRLHAWMSRRVAAAERYASIEHDGDDDDDDDDAPGRNGSDMLARVATIVAAVAALPLEIAEPSERSAGDVVPYAAHGEDAVTIARALAAADWPRERADIMRQMYACVILAGAELRDIEDDSDASAHRRASFLSRMALERDMWRAIADCACGPSSVASASALQAALDVDDLDDAPCETIPALYALLLAPDVDAHARRAAYALLASSQLLQAAVVGLDARVADVAKVERALDAALEARDDSAPFIDESPVERAGMREDLAHALDASDIAGAPARYAWALLLRYISALDVDSPCRERLVNYTRETRAIPRVLGALVREMPLPRIEHGKAKSVVGVDAPAAWRGVDWTDPTAPLQMFDARHSIAALIYGAALRALPASVRTFVHDLKPPKTARALEAATAASVSSTLIAAEFAAVSSTSFASRSGAGAGEVSVRANASTGEILARYEIDESFLELSVKLPSTYPLTQAELRFTQRLGFSELQTRTWILGMSGILTHQNGAVAQGLLQWQRNIAAEFVGVEPCPICYAVIHPVDRRKPSMRCRQCDNAFHGTCLYTWFRTGSRSICPLCQQQWGTSLRD